MAKHSVLSLLRNQSLNSLRPYIPITLFQSTSRSFSSPPTSHRSPTPSPDDRRALTPPFTAETAHQKVKVAQALWNTQDPQRIVKAYTPTSIWRNRSVFATGHAQIIALLTAKWERERYYRLRKELFCWHDDRIAVQFWYEYRDAFDGMKLKRCYGLEDWTFDRDGRMRKRMMSGNDVEIGEGERWFLEGREVEDAEIGEEHW